MISKDRRTILEIFKNFGEKLNEDLLTSKTFSNICGQDLYVSINFKSLKTGSETLTDIQVDNRFMEIRAFYFRMLKKGSTNNSFKRTIRTKSGIFKVEAKFLKPWNV